MKRFLSILLFCSLFSQAQTTYTVASGGTLANSYTLNAGDQLLLQRGGTWNRTQQVTIVCNGTTGNPARIGAYGTGELPIVTTMTSLPGWNNAANWTAIRGDSVWKMTVSMLYASYRLYFSKAGEYTRQQGARAYFANPGGGLVDSINRFQNYACTIDAEYSFRVYSPGVNPASYYSNIEYAGEVSTAIEVSGHDFIFENIDVRGGYNTSLFLITPYNFTIQNCKIGWDAAHSGVAFQGTTRSGEIKNNLIHSGNFVKDRWTFQQGPGDGILFDLGLHDLNIHNNEIRNWGHSGYEILTQGQTPVAGDYKDGWLISNVNFYDNVVKATDNSYGRAFALDVVHGTGVKPNTVRLYRNWFDSCAITSQLNCEGAQLIYNIFSNTRNSENYNYNETDVAYGVALGGYNMTTPKRMLIANNTFYRNESGGLAIGSANAAGYDSVTNNTIINNIFYNNGWKGGRSVSTGHLKGYQLLIENSGSPDAPPNKLGPHTIKNNLFLSDYPSQSFFCNLYPNPTGDGANWNKSYTFMVTTFPVDQPTWTVTGNLYGNPLFTSASDLTLLAGSPALLAGYNLSDYSLPDGLKGGSVWPSGVLTAASVWNIGAYQASADAGSGGSGGGGTPTEETGTFKVYSSKGKRVVVSGKLAGKKI